jgi:hypothetical protein
VVGSYLRDTLKEGSADGVAFLPVPRGLTSIIVLLVVSTAFS